MPDPEEFELVVEDMEGLELLIKRFAPEDHDAPQPDQQAERKRQAVSSHCSQHFLMVLCSYMLQNCRQSVVISLNIF